MSPENGCRTVYAGVEICVCDTALCNGEDTVTTAPAPQIIECHQCQLCGNRTSGTIYPTSGDNETCTGEVCVQMISGAGTSVCDC